MAKRIGFVDYNADNFHANVYLKGCRNELANRGYEVAGVTALQKEPSKAWAKANDVPWFKSVEALDEVADVYMVLAPSNPETHLDLAEMAFEYGKPTYVDKTFAPDLETAKTIFSLADKYGVPMQTTSALRYTNVQETAATLGQVKHMVALAPGGSFGEYAIHPLEMIISCMGSDVLSVMRRGEGDVAQLLLNFTEGRTAVANIYCGTQTPYAAVLTSDEKSEIVTVNLETLFVDTLAGILDFFDAGSPSIDRSESLTIRAILDVAEDSKALTEFVALPPICDPE